MLYLQKDACRHLHSNCHSRALYLQPRTITLQQTTTPSGRSAQDEALDRLLSPAPPRTESAVRPLRAPLVASAPESVQLSTKQGHDFTLQPANVQSASTETRTFAHTGKMVLFLAVMAAMLVFAWQQMPQEQGIGCLPDCSATTLARQDMAGLTLRAGNFTDADLQETNLRGASLYQALFLRANLRDATLASADLSQAILSNADLRGADLTGANLRHADLRNADLRNANLSEVDLRGANLGGATLLRANLEGATLTETNLDGANLRRANLQNTDFRRASLRLADLRRAILHGANFAGADLDDVILDANQTITPLQTGAP